MAGTAAPAAPAAPAPPGGMNKMLITLPLIFFANRIDWTNPIIVWVFRGLYALVSLVAAGLYNHIKGVVTAKNDTRRIKINEAAPSMFGAGEPVIKRTTYLEHEQAKAGEGLQQAIVGCVMMSFFSFYMNVHLPLLMQVVMTPLNLYENPLITKYILKSKVEGAWNETVLADGEEDEDDAAATTDGAAAADASAPAAAAAGSGSGSSGSKTLSGADAKLSQHILAVFEDRKPVDIALVTKLVSEGANINLGAGDDGWTTLMIACTFADNTPETVQELLDLGANPTASDNEGWTALHWASFHNSPPSVEGLLTYVPADKVATLRAAVTKDGETPLKLANDAKNAAVVALLEAEEVMADASAAAGDAAGLRRRKTAAAAEEEEKKDAPIEDID